MPKITLMDIGGGTGGSPPPQPPPPPPPPSEAHVVILNPFNLTILGSTLTYSINDNVVGTYQVTDPDTAEYNGEVLLLRTDPSITERTHFFDSDFMVGDLGLNINGSLPATRIWQNISESIITSGNRLELNIVNPEADPVNSAVAVVEGAIVKVVWDGSQWQYDSNPVLVDAYIVNGVSPQTRRYVYPQTNPTIVTSYTDTTGTLITIEADQDLDGHTGYSLSATGGAVTLTYVSGDYGTNSKAGYVYVFSTSRTITQGEILTLSYTPGDVVGWDNGLSMNAFGPISTINNSTAT